MWETGGIINLTPEAVNYQPPPPEPRLQHEEGGDLEDSEESSESGGMVQSTIGLHGFIEQHGRAIRAEGRI